MKDSAADGEKHEYRLIFYKQIVYPLVNLISHISGLV